MDREALMAKALEGKFFWTPYSDAEEDRTTAARAIRDAQRKLRASKAKPDEVIRKERAKKVLLKKKSEGVRRIPERFRVVRDEIAKLYDIPPEVLLVDSRVYLISEARHHFLWSLVRYFPKTSISGIGKIIGRHHSTVLHSCKVFEKTKSNHEDKIAHLDKMMNYSV